MLHLVFVVEPVAANVSLNTSADFTCVCMDCYGQYWTLNEVPASYNINQDNGVTTAGPVTLSDGSKQYSMTVPAIEFFNNTDVVCVITRLDHTIPSAAALMIIQGTTWKLNLYA